MPMLGAGTIDSPVFAGYSLSRTSAAAVSASKQALGTDRRAA